MDEDLRAAVVAWQADDPDPATVAELDAVLAPAMAAHMPLIVGDLEMRNVAGSGHWTQQEKPEEVNRLILDWMERRFPK